MHERGEAVCVRSASAGMGRVSSPHNPLDQVCSRSHVPRLRTRSNMDMDRVRPTSEKVRRCIL